MILCCGEALIDMLPRQTEAGEAAFAPYPGGAVFNTAIALGRLGRPAGLLTGISTDLFGETLIGALAASQVETRYAVRADRPTTLAFVTLTDGQARYAFYDENTAGRLLAPADLPTDLSGVAALFFGGISLAVEPAAASYEGFCLAHAAERAVMLDPNIREGFVTDPRAYRQRLERMIAAADVVKLSDEDLRWIMGPGPLDSVAAELLDQGPRVVCVTQGAGGVLAVTPEGMVSVPARTVEVVDTVGAGDTFNAGLMAGLDAAGLLTKAALRQPLPEGALRDAVALGVEAAAVTVSRAGANPPWHHEV